MILYNLFISFSYLFNLILNVLCLKGINYYFGIDDIVFCCILYGWSFPLAFIHGIMMGMVYSGINCLIGFLDYIQVVLLYVGINQVNIAQYIGYRTISLVFNFIMSTIFLDKTFCRYQKTGIVFISGSCIVLLVIGGNDNIVYGGVVCMSSFIYSILGFLMEKYHDECDYKQIKSISSFFCIVSYTGYGALHGVVPITNPIVWLMIGFMGGSEYIHYNLKQQIVGIENGSVHIGILDIVRRIITLIISVLIFKETYAGTIYWCYSIMILGCILFNFNTMVDRMIVHIKNKLCGYYYFDNGTIEMENNTV
jgi:hypothetical protein